MATLPTGKAKRLWHDHRLAVVLTTVALLAFGGWWMFGGRGSKSHAAYDQVAVVQGDIQEIVTAQGKLEPRTYVNVGAQVSGQLDKLHVQAGDVVQKGDLMAEIDPRVYQARVEQGQAGLNSLNAQMSEQKAQLVLAEQQQARNQKMYDAQAISKDTYDTSVANVSATVARVNSLKAQIAQAASSLSEDKTNLSYTKIYAPMAGTVVSTSVQEGQTLNANQQAPTLAEVADLGTMTVRAQVAEADVPHLQAGAPAFFTTLGSDRRWDAKVRQILPSPEIVNDVVLFDVLVDVDNSDGVLMDGMSTQMSFVVGKASNVPLIPVAALGTKVSNTTVTDTSSTTPLETYKVRVPGGAKGHPMEKKVTVSLMDRTMAQVVSGLNVGDVVLVPSTGASAGKSGKGRMMGPRL